MKKYIFPILVATIFLAGSIQTAVAQDIAFVNSAAILADLPAVKQAEDDSARTNTSDESVLVLERPTQEAAKALADSTMKSEPTDSASGFNRDPNASP